jgi:uncharacterized protein YgbK (DUF1537 family)
MLLGAVADDLTGATDLALMLARGGMRVVQVMEVPSATSDLGAVDAVVVALKTRTCPRAEAIDLSLRATDALLARGARQILFKYCSTFDSTPAGNIGPVADALGERLASPLAIVCPAFPANRRTIYRGNLFVGDQPLAESPMKDHPLTPMRDSDLVRLMAAQSKHKVGLVAFETVNAGPDAIRVAFERLRAAGVQYAVCDAVTDRHLIDLGTAAHDHILITGGSGIALGLPDNFAAAGLLQKKSASDRWPAPAGRGAVLAGSCSDATRGQIARAIAANLPTRRLDPAEIVGGKLDAQALAAWALDQNPATPPVIYSSAEPTDVRRVQAEFGTDRAGHAIEVFLADVARHLTRSGVTRLIVAGGETSGAVVNGLGIGALEIGPEIAPGVPWTRAVGRDLVLALKSGNFGGPDFFTDAWSRLD